MAEMDYTKKTDDTVEIDFFWKVRVCCVCGKASWRHNSKGNDKNFLGHFCQVPGLPRKYRIASVQCIVIEQINLEGIEHRKFQLTFAWKVEYLCTRQPSGRHNSSSGSPMCALPDCKLSTHFTPNFNRLPQAKPTLQTRNERSKRRLQVERRYYYVRKHQHGIFFKFSNYELEVSVQHSYTKKPS